MARKIILLLGIIWTSAFAFAIPHDMNYQGDLTDSGGMALDTTVAMSFKIYDAPSGGTQLWSETYLAVTSVNGRFRVLLGSSNPIPDSVFANDDTWLGVTVGSDAEMTPREQLGSVGYSYRVGTVDGASGGTINGDVVIHDRMNVGHANSNVGTYAFVAGDSNSASGFASTISGGRGNVANGDRSTIGGGWHNTASLGLSTVGGGTRNSTTASEATVAGGDFNTASALRSTVGGGGSNIASGEASTISGGGVNIAQGTYSYVGGGWLNNCLSDCTVIGGGTRNEIHLGVNSVIAGGHSNALIGNFAFIGGGEDDSVGANYSTIGGGRQNTVTNQYSSIVGGRMNSASGTYSHVGGGYGNAATADYSCVPGGLSNLASGSFAFAGGQDANATHFGSFVWSSGATPTLSFADNSATLRAPGGFHFLTGFGATGAQLASGATAWSVLSDSTMKMDRRPTDTKTVLQKLSEISIENWKYKHQPEGPEHIGPMAQDFYNAFGLGDDDKTISTLDADGVLFAAVKELAKQNESKSAEIAELKSEIEDMKSVLRTLMQMSANTK